jgi:hypothetical protein
VSRAAGPGGSELVRQANVDHRDSPDSVEPRLATDNAENADAAEPTEPTEATEPADPTDRIDPTEPIDRMDPFEPMLRIEFSEPIDHFEPCRSEPCRFVMPGILASSPGHRNATPSAIPQRDRSA